MFAILGIPWLGAAIAGFFTSIITWLSNYVSKRILIIGVVITAWGVAFASLKAATIGVANLSAYALPTELMQFAGAVIPDNLGTVLSAYGGVQLGLVAYKVQLRVLGFKAQV